MGECALAKALGLYWCGTGILRSHDVGNFDVRTRARHNYDLIIHPQDKKDKVVWLVTGLNGEYTVQGWITAEDGKKSEYWKDPAGGRAAYFFPKEMLNKAWD